MPETLSKTRSLTATKTQIIVAVMLIAGSSVAAAGLIIQSLSNSANNFGYGYGYGYGVVCTVPGPSGLQTLNRPATQQVRLRWLAPDFATCGSTLQYYQVEVWRGTTLVHTATSTSLGTVINYRQLVGRGSYRYQVRAYTTDGDYGSWSSWKNFNI